MSKTFLTNPKASDGKKPKLTPFDFKETVTATFMKWGIPLRIAELAVIDYKSDVYQGYKDKLTPMQTAVKMVDKIRKVYNVERNTRENS